MSANSDAFGFSPKIVTISPAFASIPVTSSINMSIQIFPIVGAGLPLI